MNDPQKLMSILAGLGETYGKEVTKTMADVYWHAFSDYSDGQIDRACQVGLKVWRCIGRIPTPAEIIDCIEGQGSDSALIAWDELLRSIRHCGPYKSVLFADSRITKVVEAFGGWIAVNQWLENEMQYRRQEFMKMYASLRNGGDRRALAGLVELQNAALGYLDRIPDAILIGKRNAEKSFPLPLGVKANE